MSDALLMNCVDTSSDALKDRRQHKTHRDGVSKKVHINYGECLHEHHYTLTSWAVGRPSKDV